MWRRFLRSEPSAPVSQSPTECQTEHPTECPTECQKDRHTKSIIDDLVSKEGIQQDGIDLIWLILGRCWNAYNCPGMSEHQRTAVICACALIATKCTGHDVPCGVLVVFAGKHGAHFTRNDLKKAEVNVLDVVNWHVHDQKLIDCKLLAIPSNCS